MTGPDADMPRVTITTTGTTTGPTDHPLTVTTGPGAVPELRLTVAADDPPLLGDDWPDALTVPQAAELIGRTPGLIRRWIEAGELPARRVALGGRAMWVIRPIDLAAVNDKPVRRGWTDEDRAKRAAARAARRGQPAQLTVNGWLADHDDEPKGGER